MRILGLLLGFILGASLHGFVGAVIGALAGALAAVALKRALDTSGATQLQNLERDIAHMRTSLADALRRIRQLEAAQSSASARSDSGADAPQPEISTASPIEPDQTIPPTPDAAPRITPETPPSEPVSPPAPPIPSSASVTAPAPPPEPPGPEAPPGGLRDQLPGWLDTLLFAGNPLAKVGVLILFLGLAFLLRYTAEHVSVPVEFRYAGVAAAAIALLLLGWRMRERRDRYGLILQGAGIATLYLTTLAAMKLHPLIAPGFGFTLLAAVAALAALLAVLQNARVLAVVAALGGFAAPVLASTGSGSHVALFSYLALLDTGILMVAWFKTWRALNLIGFFGTLLLGLAWGQHRYQPVLFPSTEPFLVLFFLMFVAITILFARNTLAVAGDADQPFDERLRRALPQVAYVDATLTFGVPMGGFGLQYLLVRHWEYGAAMSALALSAFYLAAGWLLLNRNHARYLLLVEAFAAIGTIFVTLAVPLALDNSWTAAAWAVEAAGIYWIGLRQDRRHARLFALAVLAGSALFFMRETVWRAAPTILEGSVLGCLLIAASALFIFGKARQHARPLGLSEAGIMPGVALVGAAFVYLAPAFMFGLDGWCIALALLGFATVFAARRWEVAVWRAAGLGIQALAGVLFATTLHGGGGPHAAVLGDGVTGLAVALALGAAMLGAARLSTPRPDGNRGSAAAVGIAAIVVSLLGLVFVSLAVLFVLPWRHATGLWAVSGFLILMIAVRLAHLWMTIFALTLQGVAGLIFLAAAVLAEPSYFSRAADIHCFRHSGWWTPMVMSLAAFGCAFLFRGQDRDRNGPRAIYETPLLAWGVGWWAFACWGEIVRFVPGEIRLTAAAAATVASIAAWGAAARGLRWRGLYQTTILHLFVLAPLGLTAVAEFGHPAAHYGWIVWPFALALHLILLLGQERWLDRTSRQTLCVLGVWLFVVLASAEARWQFARLGEPESAWAMLGWAIVPTAYLIAVSSPWVRGRWPVADDPRAYRWIAAAPMVVYALGWALWSNLHSNGSAAPLPYVPLINPLEIAQMAVILCALRWFRESLGDPEIKLYLRPAQGDAVAGGVAFACLTGAVLRASHHWGGVPWDAGRLIASTLVQTALSLTWTVLASTLMVVGHRRDRRPLWFVGAALIAVVVVKLFLVELANTGSLARIVSFVVVGGLLLALGRLAPVPPRVAAPDGPPS
jgi:uncharacterized membrane protein